jgi:hypothetical protein
MHSCSILIISLSLVGREVLPAGLSASQVVNQLPDFAGALVSFHVTYHGKPTS